MSFTVKTYQLGAPGQPSVQLAEIYKPSEEFYSGGKHGDHANFTNPSSLAPDCGIYPYFAGVSAYSSPESMDFTETPIDFLLIGTPGTFLGGGVAYSAGFTAPSDSITRASSMYQNITAYPITMPSTESPAHKGYCNFLSGFGFGLESYLDGYVLKQLNIVSGFIGYGDYIIVKPHFNEDDFKSQGIESFGAGTGIATGYPGTNGATSAPFLFSNNPYHDTVRSYINATGIVDVTDGTSLPVEHKPPFLPFYYKARIAAFNGYSVSASDASDHSATTVLAEADVLPFKRGEAVAQVYESVSLMGPLPSFMNDRPEFFHYDPYSAGPAANDVSFEYPVMFESNIVAIDEAISESEMALYRGIIDRGSNTNRDNNLKARYVSDVDNTRKAKLFVAARVAYLSTALEATFSLETPKAFRVKKQISPELHKRNYTTFTDTRDGFASSTSGSPIVTGGSGGSTY